MRLALKPPHPNTANHTFRKEPPRGIHRSALLMHNDVFSGARSYPVGYVGHKLYTALRGSNNSCCHLWTACHEGRNDDHRTPYLEYSCSCFTTYTRFITVRTVHLAQLMVVLFTFDAGVSDIRQRNAWLGALVAQWVNAPHSPSCGHPTVARFNPHSGPFL